MIWRMPIVLLMVGLVLCAAGCAAATTEAPKDEPAQPLEPSTLPPELQGAGATPGDTAAERARADLAKRLDMEDREITIVSVEAVDWPDTSLGCPQPGKLYAQVVTPGYYIVLEAKGQQHAYHTDSEADQLIRCSDDKDRVETMRQASSPEQARVTARHDLASRLGIPADEVSLVAVTEEMFPAGDLGCPCPGCPTSPMTGLVSGERIILAAQDREYEYRARGMAVLFCGER